MIDNTWILTLQNEIFTLVKTRAQAILNDKYPNAFWTTESSTHIEPIFPTIYITFSGMETGSDLTGLDVNGVILDAQIEIYTERKQSKVETEYISGVVLNEFKRLGFFIRDIPHRDDTNPDIRRVIYTAGRVVGQADLITDQII